MAFKALYVSAARQKDIGIVAGTDSAKAAAAGTKAKAHVSC